WADCRFHSTGIGSSSIISSEPSQGGKPIMTAKMILTGDVNLMNVTDPAVPFAQVADEFRNTDVVFSNLECCLYETSFGHSVRNEGFFADPKAGKALTLAGIQVVGIANNVHYGDAAILSSITR